MTAGGILIVDKPAGWTSHDVVAKLRGKLRERRIGHGGTLDPMATGVLVAFVGRATRAVPYLPGDKTYHARFRVGFATNTLDITGEITRRFEKLPSEDELAAVLPRFTGDIMQIPPMVSAVKKDGQPLYKLARKGVEVEREPRSVRIDAIDWLGREGDEYALRVRCSAGTYIRTLVDDIGRALGCGACLSFLRRERSGPFSLSDAAALEEAGWDRLVPVDTLFRELKAYTAEPAESVALKNGNPIRTEAFAEGTKLRVYAPDGEFLMLGRVDDGLLRVERSFFEVRS